MKISKEQLLEYRSGLIDIAPTNFTPLRPFDPFVNFNFPKMRRAQMMSAPTPPPPSPFAVSRKPEEEYKSPLYDPRNPQASKVPQYQPRSVTVTPQGGAYPTTFQTNPTVQQRLRLTGAAEGDTTLSRKERGVPVDRSEELVGKAVPKPAGTWMDVSRVVFNPNYQRDLSRASGSIVPTMVTKYTTYYDRLFKPSEDEED
jgi:hypothetical protein